MSADHRINQIPRWKQIYRATFTQAIIIGTLSFTQPGIWSAISGLGAGGLASVGTNNSANAILFGIMFILSPVYAILINKVGIKPIVSIGTIGYVIWSAGLYQNSKDGTQWLIIFGATTCGISASAFWTSEGTIAALYPDDNQRGLFIATWQVINKVGGLIAGAVTLSLNINNNKAGSVSLVTYEVLIALQCLGLPISFLLAAPEKVFRKDGKRLKSNITRETWKQRGLNSISSLKKKEVLLLIPLMISNVWFGTWQSNYVTNHFSVRVRSLNSLLTALIPGIADVLAGWFMDLKIRKSVKVKASWTFIAVYMVAFFIYSFVLQAEFDNNPESGIDWSGNPRYARSFIPLQLFKIPGELSFNWLYWVIGAYHFKSSEIPYISGWIRTFESLGQCLAFVIGTVNDNDMTNLIVSAVVFFVSIPSVTYLAWQSDDETESKFITEEEEEEEAESESESVTVEKLEISGNYKSDST